MADRRKIQSLERADATEPETWIKLAVELADQGHLAEAKRCLEMVKQLPNADEQSVKLAAGMIELIDRQR